MTPLRYFLGLCLLVACTALPGTASAQQHILNADSLLVQAQQQAQAGKYNNSRKMAQQVLAVAPHYSDAIVLIGRTYAWQHKADSARIVLLPLVQQEPPHQGALLALADVELWAGDPEQSLQHAQQGLAATPTSVPLQLAMARALRDLKRYKEANELLKSVVAAQPQNEVASALLEQMVDANLTHRLKVEHQTTFFTDNATESWQLSQLEYTHLAPKAKFIARVSRAQRYSQQSLQGELEAYPQLGKSTYAYINAGISDNNLFPTYRTGAEIYQLLPFKLEASVGARTLFFPSQTVVLYTGHLGKYFGKQWIAFRPFFQKQHDGWQTTGILQLRQYFKQEDEHITLVLSKGSTPFSLVGFEEIARLDATRVGLESQFRLSKRYLAGATLMYEREEYTSEAHRNRITTGLFVQAKF
ncbi:YaiO family outer membrane beta-barrel protein [Pontibacter harenae]|uniref:YaiO family outer membrane beta-barrel protein n=1 Tax=Pontibacter harenae TaxID=2894083 RepID=UPI001E5632AC|nr:YaiO family outer membrane beta-barrel protein [Pontibacter harenae]MCC9167523.1 YaiO family outer membrane beta-barrel protein [Pontibacter harenae]